MGGGLMQLVQYGAQDLYLTGNPEITFFKAVYRRYTNFAMESIAQTFNGDANFGNKVACVLSRNGDLIGPLLLEATLPQITTTTGTYITWSKEVGHELISEVEIEIGGSRIDKHYGEWLEIWEDITIPSEKINGYNTMVDKHLDEPSSYAKGITQDAEKLYIPFQFWFCRNPGLYIPLIALQYHEVIINLTLASQNTLQRSDNNTADTDTGLTNVTLYATYVYLDTDERRQFAQTAHEYLIEQLQFQQETIAQSSSTTDAQNIKLNFSHPTKELIWVLNSTTLVAQNLQTGNDPYRFCTDNASGNQTYMSTGKLILNGADRFSTRDDNYFQLVQSYYYHTRIPEKRIYTYSFSLKPEEHQPSGTCNFSRIDNAILAIVPQNTADAALNIDIYAVNYNILRIVSGMGGLAYSN